MPKVPIAGTVAAIAVAGMAYAGTLDNVRILPPPTLPMDKVTRDTEEGARSLRRYFSERLDYMTAHRKELGIPDEAVVKAQYAKDQYEEYLVEKGYTTQNGGTLKDRPRSPIEPIISAVTDIELVRKAYALTFGIEDFESCGAIPCSFTSNDSYDLGDFALDTTSKINGTNSGRCDTGGVGAGCLLTKTLTSGSEYYIQFYFFLPTGWTFGANGYASLFATEDGTGFPVYCNIEDWGTVRITCAGDELSYTNTGVDIALNTKTRLEFHIKVSSTAGDLDIWNNNTTVGSPDYNGSGTLNTGTQNITAFYIGGYHPDIVNDAFYDDVCVNTAFMGTTCIATTAAVSTDDVIIFE